MSFLDDLAAGRLGLVVRPPEQLQIKQQTDTSVELTDPRDGLGWWFFFFPGVRLDLDHAQLLRRDVERHTRVLFDAMYAYMRTAIEMPADARPRTADASWSPLVELERIDLRGGPALTVIHRMVYQPTREIVMGHTLIPLANGLFEARWIASTQQTGYRESVLMLKLSEGETTAFLPQATYDDPSHDAGFPQHPLTRARAAKRWYDPGCQILEPGPAARREVALAPLSCVVTVPPRFMLAELEPVPGATFTRASFAGTDGVDRLIVCRTPEKIRGIAVERRLASFARERSRAAYEGLPNITCESVDRDDDLLIVTEADPGGIGASRIRSVSRWFRDGAGQVWYVALLSTIAVPTAEMLDDVVSVARSWKAA